MGKRILVLGGGITGVATALRAAERGLSPVVLEASEAPGGMSGPLSEEGFVLDHGIHGLYSARPETRALVQEMAERFGDDFLTVSKKTSIYFRGRMLRYPMGIRDMLRALPLRSSLACVGDFVSTRLRRRVGMRGDGASFRTWVSERFGKRLYALYFGPYVEKVWGLPGSELSSAWLARRISTISIATVVRDALRSLFVRRPKEEMHSLQPQTFLYARKGSGELVERVLEAARRRGATLATGHRVIALRPVADGWEAEVETASGRQTLQGDAVVNTLPLPLLLRLLGDAVPEDAKTAARGLRFRSMCIVNLFIEGAPVYDDQWVYYSAPEFAFNRVNEFTNLGPGFSPEGKTALNCEITCFKGDATWNASDEELVERCVTDLERLGVLDGSRVFHASVARLPNAYPVFDVGCEKRLGTVLDAVAALPDLETAGRQGRFEYINMDECIWHAGQAVDAIARGTETSPGRSSHDSRVSSLDH